MADAPNRFRPTVRFDPSYGGPLTPEFSQQHEHEFGQGFDVYYRDPSGVIRAKMDGLTPEEALVLQKKRL